jgi:hypothetical protein
MNTFLKSKLVLLALAISVISIKSLPDKKRLSDYGFDIYSQYGEDGIVQKIFEMMGTTTKVAVEFGAWNGIHLSNTANLWINDKSWRAVLIESDQKKFEELKKTLDGADVQCLAIQAYVGIEADNSIEYLLKMFNVEDSIDLMSIDIDGNEYYIFENLKTLRPRLIICEYNPTIPVTMDVYAPYSESNKLGASVGALNRIAEEKGYKLIALTNTNAFFVINSEFSKFKDIETNIKLMDDHTYMVNITDYDGNYANISTQRVALYGIKQQFRGAMSGKFVRNDVIRPLPLPQQQPDHNTVIE